MTPEQKRWAGPWRIAVLSCLALLCGQAGWGADRLHARVLLDDVIPPPSPIVVRLVCGSEAIAETTADEQGRFSMNLPGADSGGCRLTASAAGYESDTVTVDQLPLNPAIGALALKRAGRWNGYALSATSLAVKSQARNHFGVAVHAMRQGGQAGMSRAENELALAAKADPGFAEAWYQLGRLRLARQDVDGGRQALRQALVADPWYVSPYRPLLLLELGEERWRQVEALGAQLLELNPYLADIHYYRGLAAAGLDDMEAASAEAAAIANGPEGDSFALLHHLRGLIFERQGRLDDAKAAYRTYLELDPEGPAAEETRGRLAALEGS